MKIIKISNFDDEILQPIAQNVCCLGLFDGLHKAHQRLINVTCEIAKRVNAAASFFTLDQMVNDYFTNSHTQLISNDDKQIIINRFGFDYYFEMQVNAKTLSLTKDAFIRFLQQKLCVSDVVVGYDYTFAKGKSGNVNDLVQKFGDEHVHVIEEMKLLSEKYSSSKIREMLRNHEIIAANQQLLKPYDFQGIVVYGKALGRTIAFPTINQSPEQPLLIPFGTYITKVILENGKTYPGISCYHAAVNGSHLLETHLLNFSGDLYGQKARVSFISYLRDNVKIADLAALRDFLAKDKQDALAFFAKHE